MKFNDAHIYYDDLRTDFNQLENLNKKYQCEFIISPQCTIQSEPEKSNLMYFLQPYLLSNKFLYYIAMAISKTFYKQNKLKFFWKIFTGFKNYHKITIPNNNDVLNIIEKYHFIKSWLWINPTEEDSLKEFESLYNHPKIVGIKLHNYWHNLGENEINIILENNKKNKPVYIILKYQNIKKILDLLRKFNNTKFIIGYGGFPHYGRIWDEINKLKNVYIDVASKHLNKKLINKIFEKFDKNKIIFSSDYPYNFQDKKKFSYQLFLKRINTNHLSNKERNDFFINNIKNIIHG